MAQRASDRDVGVAPDLLADAARGCDHARLTIDLIARQLTFDEFGAPTDHQVADTARVLDAFTDSVVRRFLALAEKADPRIKVSVIQATPASTDPDLVAAALARSDEHRVTQALRRRATGSLDPLASGADGEEAELAFALLRAVDRRVNSYDEPVMVAEDVGSKTLERLVWCIAAEVRAAMARSLGDLDELDRALTAAAKQLAGPYRRRRPGSAERVAQRLLAADADLHELLTAALNRAQPRLFCALLAVRLRLPATAVLPALTQPERLALLLAAAGLHDRDTAGILLRLSEPLHLSDDRLVAIIDGYRSLREQATVEMLRQMRLHPHYRAAIFERERARQNA